MADTSSGADAQRSASDSHNLLTIPPELLELIVEFVEPRDLLSLRRASRGISQGTSKRFLTHFFSQRAFLLNNEDSLRALLAIAEYDILARGLKTIDLCIEEVPDPDFTTEDLRELSQPTCRARNLTDKQELKCVWHQREWHKLYEKQEDDREQNVYLHLLTIIFSRIRRRDHSIEIRIVDQFEACEVPLGMKNLEWLCDEVLCPMEDRFRPVPMVLEAIALSGMPLQSFVLRYCSWDFLLETLARTPQFVINTRDAFRQLRKLHLMSDHEGPTLKREMRLTFDVIASASLVEDLSLQVRTPKERRMGTYQDLIECLCDCLGHNFPRLKTLDLQGYDLNPTQLEAIVATHPRLERLHFHGGVELHPAHPEGKAITLPHVMVEGYIYISVLHDVPQLAGFKKEMLIAPCTVVELKEGKDSWEESVRESRLSWEE
jgi:hypothetical protein